LELGGERNRKSRTKGFRLRVRKREGTYREIHWKAVIASGFQRADDKQLIPTWYSGGWEKKGGEEWCLVTNGPLTLLYKKIQKGDLTHKGLWGSWRKNVEGGIFWKKGKEDAAGESSLGFCSWTVTQGRGNLKKVRTRELLGGEGGPNLARYTHKWLS